MNNSLSHSLFKRSPENEKELLLYCLSVKTTQMVLVVKKSPANIVDAGDTNSIPGSGRSPGRGHGNPLQYSCLGNPMDRGAWRVTVCGVKRVGQASAHSAIS